MDETSACVLLLLLSLSGTVGKYVHITDTKNWHDAQKYCRSFHTDLASVSSKDDMAQLWQLGGSRRAWIGLERSRTDRETWMWSGGGKVTTFFWARGQPQNRQGEDYGMMLVSQWHDSKPNMISFFCHNVVVVRERKTWEEALEHCREHHHDLASVTSETEMLLIQKELEKKKSTGRVWIGLRFFSGKWLWVDRKPLTYEAWGQKVRPACVNLTMECAALQVKGGTAVADATAGTDVAHINNAGSSAVNNAHSVLDILAVSVDDAAAGEAEHVWEAHDCEEKLHFVCY